MHMSWGSPVWRGGAALATLAALVFPGAAMAGIVVASSGPSAARFPPGKKLPDEEKITLEASDSVTILDSRGTRVLRGAGTFRVAAPDTYDRSATFAALTRQRSAERVRTGAVRGPNGTPISPNLWYVDLSHGGTYCEVDPKIVRVWRPDKDGAASYSVTRQGGEEAPASATTLEFRDGVTVAPWDDASVPIFEDATYTIMGPDSAHRVTVTFALLPDENYAPEELAAALMARGCQAQVDLLAASLALPEDSPEGGSEDG